MKIISFIIYILINIVVFELTLWILDTISNLIKKYINYLNNRKINKNNKKEDA